MLTEGGGKVEASPPDRPWAIVRAGEWFGRFVGSAVFALTLSIGLAVQHEGLRDFWTRLIHPKIDNNAYDLLLATLAGANAILLVLWFTAAMSVAATAGSFQTQRETRALFIGSWAVVWPATLQYYAIGLLGAHAWGFTPPRLALPLLWVLGFAALVGYVRLSQQTLEAMAGQGQLTRSKGK